MCQVEQRPFLGGREGWTENCISRILILGFAFYLEKSVCLSMSVKDRSVLEVRMTSAKSQLHFFQQCDLGELLSEPPSVGLQNPVHKYLAEFCVRRSSELSLAASTSGGKRGRSLWCL